MSSKNYLPETGPRPHRPGPGVHSCHDQDLPNRRTGPPQLNNLKSFIMTSLTLLRQILVEKRLKQNILFYKLIIRQQEKNASADSEAISSLKTQLAALFPDQNKRKQAEIKGDSSPPPADQSTGTLPERNLPAADRSRMITL